MELDYKLFNLKISDFPRTNRCAINRLNWEMEDWINNNLLTLGRLRKLKVILQEMTLSDHDMLKLLAVVQIDCPEAWFGDPVNKEGYRNTNIAIEAGPLTKIVRPVPVNSSGVKSIDGTVVFNEHPWQFIFAADKKEIQKIIDIIKERYPDGD